MSPDGDVVFHDWEELRTEITQMIGSEVIEVARRDLENE